MAKISQTEKKIVNLKFWTDKPRLFKKKASPFDPEPPYFIKKMLEIKGIEDIYVFPEGIMIYLDQAYCFKWKDIEKKVVEIIKSIES